jgi:hypothetical protein
MCVGSYHSPTVQIKQRQLYESRDTALQAAPAVKHAGSHKYIEVIVLRNAVPRPLPRPILTSPADFLVVMCVRARRGAASARLLNRHSPLSTLGLILPTSAGLPTLALQAQWLESMWDPIRSTWGPVNSAPVLPFQRTSSPTCRIRSAALAILIDRRV